MTTADATPAPLPDVAGTRARLPLPTIVDGEAPRPVATPALPRPMTVVEAAEMRTMVEDAPRATKTPRALPRPPGDGFPAPLHPVDARPLPMPETSLP